MRDLNNIRVTRDAARQGARGRRRKKVKGHPALPIDERTGARKEFAKDASEEGGRVKGLLERRGKGSRQVLSFHRPFDFQ